MVITLKFLVLLGGFTAVVVGMAMLIFMEKFMAFNDYVNRNFLIGQNYDYNAFGIDRWMFGKNYFVAVVLLIIGLALLTQFARYAPY